MPWCCNVCQSVLEWKVSVKHSHLEVEINFREIMTDVVASAWDWQRPLLSFL